MDVRDVPSIYEVDEILTVSTKQHENFIFYESHTICDVGYFECSEEQIKAYCRKIIATMYQILLPLICCILIRSRCILPTQDYSKNNMKWK